MISRPGGFAGAPCYRTYLIVLLATMLTVNGIDRTALGLVLPAIKRALELTDTELGVLTGIAFFLFYSTIGVPIGRWADRGDRIAILALTAALWGVMVMLVGAARSFAGLLIVRVGVAVGEAGCVPAAYSLIGDYFAREERPRAVANFLLGNSLSIVLGYSLAGWMSYHYGWRVMFVCIGLVSVLIAPLVWWTLSEPRRGRQSGSAPASRVRPPSMLEVVPVLWRNKTFRTLVAVLALNWFFGVGIGAWVPSFLARSFGMGTERIGLALSIVYGMGGLIGTYSGGYLASRYLPRNEGRQLWILALFNIGYGVLSVFVYLSKHPSVCLILFAIAIAAGALQSGPLFATTQTVVPEELRAVSISLIFLVANLFGAGLGPLAVGALSDALHPYFGAQSLRFALLAMCPGFIAGCWLYWRASQTVAADLEVAAAQAGEPSTAKYSIT